MSTADVVDDDKTTPSGRNTEQLVLRRLRVVQWCAIVVALLSVFWTGVAFYAYHKAGEVSESLAEAFDPSDVDITGGGDEYDQCMNDESTTIEECDALLDGEDPT